MLNRSIALTLILLATACGSKSDSPRAGAKAAAEEIADGIVGAVTAAESTAAPFRCAKFASDIDDVEVELGQVAGRQAVQTGDTVTFQSNKQDRNLVIGAVADARGTGPATSAAMGRIRAAFEDQGVELVLVLGGMGGTQQELGEHLQLLTEGERWPVVVIPGDREPVPVLRKTIAAIGAGGARVLNGADVRFIVMDKTVVATFPGLGFEERIVAGAQGCAHDRQDADALGARLAKRDETKVWVSYAPPRGTDASASDVAIGGVHIGELLQTAGIAASGARLVLHAAVDEAAFGKSSGMHRLVAEAPAILGVGSVDPLPLTNERGDTRRSEALVVRIEPTRVRWKRIRGQ